MSKGKSQLKAGIVLNYINMIIGNLIPVFYTPLMLSMLGQNEYGLYKLSSSVTSYLGLISMGIGTAVTRYLIKANTEKGKEDEEKVLGLFMIIFQVIAILAFAAGTALTLNLGIWYSASLSAAELRRMKILVFIMTCNTALNFQLTPYLSVVTAHEKYIFLQCMNIISTTLVPLANLAALFMGFASVGIAVSSLALGVISRFIYLIYVRKSLDIKARYKGMPGHLFKEIIGFSFWIFVGNVVGQLYNSTDTVMIGMIPALATTGVAIYNVGGVFNNMILGLTTGISSLLSPRTNKMVFAGASNSELTDLAIRIGRIQGYIMALVMTGFIAFGRPFIHFYAGDEYYDAYWVALLLMIPNLIPLVQSVCLSITIAKNKHRFRSLVYLGIAISNVVGTWFLMQTPLGIIGAALMTNIATFIGTGPVMNIYYAKVMKLEIGRFWKEMIPIYIIPVIMCAATLAAGRWIDFYTIPTLLAGIAVYTVVFCILTRIFVLNDYEKELVRGFVLALPRKLKKKKQAEA